MIQAIDWSHFANGHQNCNHFCRILLVDWTLQQRFVWACEIVALVNFEQHQWFQKSHWMGSTETCCWGQMPWPIPCPHHSSTQQFDVCLFKLVPCVCAKWGCQRGQWWCCPALLSTHRSAILLCCDNVTALQTANWWHCHQTQAVAFLFHHSVVDLSLISPSMWSMLSLTWPKLLMWLVGLIICPIGDCHHCKLWGTVFGLSWVHEPFWGAKWSKFWTIHWQLANDWASRRNPNVQKWFSDKSETPHSHNWFDTKWEFRKIELSENIFWHFRNSTFHRILKNLFSPLKNGKNETFSRRFQFTCESMMSRTTWGHGFDYVREYLGKKSRSFGEVNFWSWWVAMTGVLNFQILPSLQNTGPSSAFHFQPLVIQHSPSSPRLVISVLRKDEKPNNLL